MDTRSAENATAGVFGANTSKSAAPVADDEDAHDDSAAGSLDFAITGIMRVDRANQTGRSLALVGAAKLGIWQPPSPTAPPNVAGGSHLASAPTVLAETSHRSNVVGALADAAKLALRATITPRAGAVVALRFTSAKCSQMLTLLRGRSHDNRPAYLHVLSADDDITSVERNDDMHGS